MEQFETIDCELAVDEEFTFNGVQWKRHPYYRRYYISEYGDVGSTYGSNFKILKTWSNQYGHRYVSVSDEIGNKKKESVHRLVAEAYLENPNSLSEVCHIDDNPKNNDYRNLFWGTHADNMRDCFNKGRNYTRPVICIETGERFSSCAEAAKHFDTTRSNITLHCQEKVHAFKNGLHLRYADSRR